MISPLGGLLANNWTSLGDRFTGRHAQFTPWDWVTLLAIITSVAGVVWMMTVYQRRQNLRLSSNRPNHLFEDLCIAHRLSFRDRRLLQALAQELELETGAVLFVRPDYFETDRLPAALRRYEIQVERLSERLFQGLEEPTATPPMPPTKEAPHPPQPLGTALDVSPLTLGGMPQVK